MSYLKKYLPVKQFAVDADMKQAFTSWLQTLDSNFFCTRMQEGLKYKCQWWLAGGLMCTGCYPRVICVLKLDKIGSIRIFDALFLQMPLLY